jgi:hypothetical protein
MSMSDPFLPVPPGSEQDRAQQEIEDLDDGDVQPDVLEGRADDEQGPTTRDGGAFRTPHPGDRLRPAELEDELD